MKISSNNISKYNSNWLINQYIFIRVVERHSKMNRNLLTGRRETDTSQKNNSSSSSRPVKMMQVFESGVFTRENKMFREFKEEHKSGITKNTESINEDSYEQLSKIASRS